MELPGLGEHCSLRECNQLDFLPFNCDSCQKIFCKDHVHYDKHNCTESYKKDVRVPVCPLCNQPVSFKPGEIPDRRVNDHIENDCKSDLALAKRKTYTNKCTVKGCKQRELVPVSCGKCRKNFCLRHRHETDHNCVGNSPSSAARQAATSRFDSYNNTRRKQPQNTYMSTKGTDLNSERQSRQQQKSTGSQAGSTTPRSLANHPPGMTEDEAMAFAIQASLSEHPKSRDESKKSDVAVTDEDLALARALAQSEIDERERRDRTTRQQQQETNKGSGCSLA
eukprot:gene6977-7762_t